MRFDSIGLFWEEVVVPKPERQKKEVEKRQPPERTWEQPDYLPYLEESKRFDVPLFSDDELVQAAITRDRLVFDIECYENYLLVAFKSVSTGKVVYFEKYEGVELYVAKLAWVVKNFLLIGFNSRHYDLPMLALALAGKSNAELKYATNELIKEGIYASDLLKRAGVQELEVNQIDTIEVAPLDASLKIYSGRLHCQKMWDLPFHPDSVLSSDQLTITRWYCINDLDNTELLYNALKDQIELRERMGQEYQEDLRSLSDAQIAERVIAKELRQISGTRLPKAEVIVGACYRYQVPAFIKFETPMMQKALELISDLDFIVADNGYAEMPVELEKLKIEINKMQYQMGMGGLHSCEKSIAHFSDDEFILLDRDVASYYPSIILNLGLCPPHLGQDFLTVYRKIVEKRLSAKKAGNKVVADSLKITINGTFGKLGSRWSILYAPNLLLQVTLTGQLSLLMLIERLELVGIEIVSANTDGIVIKCPRARRQEYLDIIKRWETDVQFETEEVEYKALYSRDVNNYIAVKFDGKTKLKGAFSKVSLSKNPTNEICVNAVIEKLVNGKEITDTIRECKDIRQFLSVRRVNGGAVCRGEYLGKAIRWYSANDVDGEIVYAATGNKVPKSECAMPMMVLNGFPQNIAYEVYEKEANIMLNDIGYKNT